MWMSFCKIKKGTLVAVMWACILVLTVLLVFVFKQNTSGKTNNGGTTGPWENPSMPYQKLDISTRFGDFTLDGYWEGQIRAEIIEEDIYVIRIYGRAGNQPEQIIFEISFGDGVGDLVGYVRVQDGSVTPVYVLCEEVAFDDSWTNAEKTAFLSMQEEVNSILSNLPFEEGNVDTLPEESYMHIETPYLTICYPEQWSQQVRVEVSGNTEVVVRFWGTPSGAEEVHLFDLIFGGEEGDLIGLLTADQAVIPVYVIVNDSVPDPSLSEDAQMEVYGMLNGINVILNNMWETGKFSYL